MKAHYLNNSQWRQRDSWLTKNTTPSQKSQLKWPCLQYHWSCNCSSCRHTQLKLIQQKQFMHQLLPKAQHLLEKPGQRQPRTLGSWSGGSTIPPLNSAKSLLPFNTPWLISRLLYNWQWMRSLYLGIRLVLIWSNFPQNTYNVYCPQQHLTAQIHYPCFVVLALYSSGSVSSFCSIRTKFLQKVYFHLR